MVENILNENNTEVYLATSKTCNWSGCNYVKFEDIEDEDPIKIASNLVAIGIAGSYELFGKYHGVYIWEPGQDGYIYLME